MPLKKMDTFEDEQKLQDEEPQIDTKDTGSQVWDLVIEKALALPRAKVDRTSFLRSQLNNYCDETQIKRAIEDKPANAGISSEQIDRLADSCIKSHVLKASMLSFGTGVWGGWAMLASLPADMVQFYWHAIVLSQKLAYLYGWPDILEEGEVDEETKVRVTLLIGVMLGAGQAKKVINQVGKQFAGQIVRRLPKQALTKTSYYPVIKQVGRWIGISITKNTFARGVARIVPIVGGFISGGLTKIMMQSMAKKLKEHLSTLKFAHPD